MKLRVLFMLLLAVAVTSVSCNKDDEDSTPRNSFTYDGTTFEVERGFITTFGDNGNGSFDWDILLVTEGINIEDGDFAGEGTGLYLDLNTSSETGLVDGTYTFDANMRDALIMTDAFLTTVIGATTTEVQATGGTVTIDGNDISFDLTTVGGQTIEGSFDGTLTMF